MAARKKNALFINILGSLCVEIRTILTINMITVFVAASMAFSAHGKLPAWTKATLAGYAADYDESHREIGVFDKDKNYYLTRTAECDSAILTVSLTRDRKVVQNAGYAVPGFSAKDSSPDHHLKTRSLRSLSTSMGVAIGDSESKLREIMGKPSKDEDEGSQNQYHSLTYSFQTKKLSPRDIPVQYVHKYIFKENRLIEIHIGRYYS